MELLTADKGQILSLTEDELTFNLIREFEKPVSIEWVDDQLELRRELDYNEYLKLGTRVALISPFKVDKQIFQWLEENNSNENLLVLCTFIYNYWLAKKKSKMYILIF